MAAAHGLYIADQDIKPIRGAMGEVLPIKKKGLGLNALALKLIAAAAMLCDHTAVVFFNGNYAMRAAGRLAFPIFAFFIAEGYLYTRDVKKYTLRLALFAILAQGAVRAGIR